MLGQTHPSVALKNSCLLVSMILCDSLPLHLGRTRGWLLTHRLQRWQAATHDGLHHIKPYKQTEVSCTPVGLEEVVWGICRDVVWVAKPHVRALQAASRSQGPQVYEEQTSASHCVSVQEDPEPHTGPQPQPWWQTPSRGPVTCARTPDPGTLWDNTCALF